MSNDFYLRYYVGHKGKFGHEFLEFEFRPDGKLRLTSHANLFLVKDARKIIERSDSFGDIVLYFVLKSNALFEFAFLL